MEGREALQASDQRASDEDGKSDGGYEEEDGEGNLHVWTPCVRKGDLGSPCGDGYGKGSHICMAPMHKGG